MSNKIFSYIALGVSVIALIIAILPFLGANLGTLVTTVPAIQEGTGEGGRSGHCIVKARYSDGKFFTYANYPKLSLAECISLESSCNKKGSKSKPSYSCQYFWP